MDPDEIIDPGHFARHGYPHAAWRRLRREAPVSRWERHTPPFWALVRHADIVAVSRQPQRFSSAERFQYVPEAEEFGAIDFEFRDAGLQLTNEVRQAAVASRKKRGT